MFETLTEAIAWVNGRVPAVQDPEMTIGDAFQGAYADIGGAMEAALLTRLRLAQRYDVRFGIGWGEIASFDTERAPMAQSGSAWWAAREAIDQVAKTASKRQWPRCLRTLVSGAPEPLCSAVNAFLICRDALLSRMDATDFRITLGLFLGQRQVDIGRDLGITQPSIARRQVENGPSAVYQAHQAARDLAR